MFTVLIAFIFWRKGSEMLPRLLMTLMVVMAAGFLKDALVLSRLVSLPDITLEFATAADMVAVPLYAFILIELCTPGFVTVRMIFITELPFVTLPILLMVSHSPVFYYVDLGLALSLGLATATWTCVAIPKYNRYLKATFSYDDNINLKWLQSILWAFFLLLTVWAASCIVYSPWVDVLYAVINLQLWMFICFFIYKHQSVVDELRTTQMSIGSIADCASDSKNVIFGRIRKLIIDDRVYLNSMLRLSDIARLAGTNRTYASEYFSVEAGMTFYDYINGLRIKYSLPLLADTSKRLDEVAQEAGFNSRQSFHRVFSTIQGMTPKEYRESLQIV